MSGAPVCPLDYHRVKRDHFCRLAFYAAGKLLARQQWSGREHAKLHDSLKHELGEARFHAAEVLRDRELEWPGTRCAPADRSLLCFLDELAAWLALLESVCPEGKSPLPHIREALAERLQHGQTLMHGVSRPQLPHPPR